MEKKKYSPAAGFFILGDYVQVIVKKTLLKKKLGSYLNDY